MRLSAERNPGTAGLPYSHSSTIDADAEKVVAACCFTTPAAGGLHLRQPVLLGLVARLSYQLHGVMSAVRS